MQGRSWRIVVGLSVAAVCAVAAVPGFASGQADGSLFSQAGDNEPEADLRLRVRGGRDPQPGKGVRFRFSVRNTGDVALSLVRVSTRLPRTLTHLRGGRFRPGRRTVVFALGRIPAGAVRSRLMVARVADDFDPSRRITLVARVKAHTNSE